MIKKKSTKKLLLWLATTKLLKYPRKIIRKAFLYGINFKWSTNAIYNPEFSKVKDLIKEIKNEKEMLLGDWEAFQIFMAVKQTAKIKGDIAEVGVYMGGSSKLICEAKGNKKFHLFDTFEGLPAPKQEDSPNQFHEKQYSHSYANVKKYLSNYQNVYFYKGLFPSTAVPITNEKFSFVHLDVDLYEATLDCIKFFYSRMEKGGILISHDYGNALGVRRAFDEFFHDKPEPIIEIEILGSQSLIVKT
jgi:O-methyltransferase